MAQRKYQDLSANTVATVAIVAPANKSVNYTNTFFSTSVKVIKNRISEVEVINITGTSPVYFTTNGVSPTIEGDDTYVLAAIAGASMTVSVNEDTDSVKLISAGTPTVAVYAR